MNHRHYSQPFFFFVTYKGAQQAVVFVTGKPFQPNVITLAYWAHSQVIKNDLL
jgi:hypothetical protein